MRTTKFGRPLILSLALIAFLLMTSNAAFASANIVIVNVDGPGEGFNDATPVAPVGGNTGTTLGQQRLNAFQFAANIWGASLDSDVDILVQSSFDPLFCTAGSATLGAAGTLSIFADFTGAELPSTFYHAALSNRLAGVDLLPGPTGTSADDMVAFFNSNLGNAGCLTGVFFYLGLDNNHGANIDLVTVLLHEFGHGLGFANFVTEATGLTLGMDLNDVYSEYTRDLTTGLNWNQMTPAQKVASAINPRRVAWDGLHVSEGVPDVLSLGTPLLRVNSPGSIAGDYLVGAAAFGPPLSSPGVTGAVVAGLDPADGAGPTTFDACSPLTNAAAVNGNIALVNRGTCTFVTKVKNAQNAGAIAVIVADNAAGSPPAGLGGVDPTIVIPSVRITLADGTTIRNTLATDPVNATLGVDLAIRAGADAGGRALVFSPNPVQPGSSISHWDTSAFPNQLMEPAVNADLTHSVDVPQDLTLREMTDIGWFSDFDGVPDGKDHCLGSDTGATVVIQGCNSGVGNANSTLRNGCTVSDEVSACAAASASHDEFLECTAGLTNTLKKSGFITGRQQGQIQACAGRSSLP
ncbi:MAG: peptidase [Acidobacteria bacterium]|nr:peptidase [Acidobacteriota bacterium]